MKTKLLLLLLLPMLIGPSCKKGESGNYMTVYGYVKSKTSGAVLPNMTVYIEIYKNGKGFGIINGERTDYGGQGKTNKEGYYEVKAKLFEGADGLKMHLFDSNGNVGAGNILLVDLNDTERQEVNLEF